MRKKIFAIALSLLMAVASLVTLVACGGDEAVNLDESSGGKTLRIYCWNDEFKTRFNRFYNTGDDKTKLSWNGQDVTVVFQEISNQNNVYQNALDGALMNQSKTEADGRIDIFLVEADYCTKYTATNYALDVINDVGLTETDVSKQYQYTKDVVTFDSKLKGVSWQACPMGFMYRRSMAKAVLGSDDPTFVQGKIDTWAKFDAVAKQMNDAGNFMLSGYDDDFRVFTSNRTSAWTDEDDRIVIDEQINKWIDQTYDYTTKGYNNKGSLWSTESTDEMAPDGKVFGYFGPAWFMDYCFRDYTLANKYYIGDVEANGIDEARTYVAGNGGYGDWGMVLGPQQGFWGGTWICGADGTDNLDLVKDIMKKMTCDKTTLEGICDVYGDFTNSTEAMEEKANDTTYGYAFLGGQNHIKVLFESAKNIHMGTSTIYDQTMTEKIQSAFKDYFDGTVTKDQAWDNFYTVVTTKHPELKKPK